MKEMGWRFLLMTRILLKYLIRWELVVIIPIADEYNLEYIIEIKMIIKLNDKRWQKYNKLQKKSIDQHSIKLQFQIPISLDHFKVQK